MTDPEQTLWRGVVEDRAQWRQVAEHLAARLEIFLERGVQIDDEGSAVDRDSFSFPIRNREPFGGPLDIDWHGVLGMEHVDGVPMASATLLIYSAGRRIEVVGQKNSTLELVYEKQDDGHAEWVTRGWCNDDYGEWADIPLRS